MRINWQNKQIARLSIKNKHLFLFLFENGSLTRLIQDRCKGRFHIDLINESWTEAMSDEKNLLFFFWSINGVVHHVRYSKAR